VLLARWIEGGLRYGLGSTLAVSREALEAIGGLGVLVDHLADDYELGVSRLHAGYAVALSSEAGRDQHSSLQLAWIRQPSIAAGSRTVRDARSGGYVAWFSPLGSAGHCSTCWPAEEVS